MNDLIEQLIDFFKLPRDGNMVDTPLGRFHKDFLLHKLAFMELYPGEWVMCMDTSILGVGCVSPEPLGSRRIYWLPRPIAEQCTLLRHLIPYVAIFNPDSNRYLVYQRKGGGEKRLDGAYSMGWGGHINPCDYGDDLDKTVYNCIQRELAEELPALEWDKIALTPLYAYQDSDAPVNSVHTCLAFLALYAGDIINGEWLTFDELSKLPMESWSMRMLAWTALQQEEWRQSNESNRPKQCTDDE